MSLSSIDIVFRRSAGVSNGAYNGGVMGVDIVPSGVKNALFPDVRSAERLAGSEVWRKAFIHFIPVDNSSAFDVKVIPWAPTTADDRVLVYPATQSDNQNDIGLRVTAGTVRPYGAARGNGAVQSGSTVITTTLEADSDGIFVAGDSVYISDKASMLSSTGSEEYGVVESVSTIAGVTTVNLVGALQNSYAMPHVSSVISAGDINALLSGKAVSSVLGTFDESKVSLSSQASTSDVFTATFSSPANFTVAGARVGSVGSGSIGTTFNAVNTPFEGNFFSIQPAAWGGTFSAGDTVSFTTTPASIPVWYRRIVPAGARSFASNSFSLVVDCESA